MKSYKLVNSQKVIDKAIRLGYQFDDHPNNARKEMIFLASTEMVYYFREIKSFNEAHSDYKEITQKDFLELPEPLKIDDWVKANDEGKCFIAQIGHIDESGKDFDVMGIVFQIEELIKLTPNQIEILEL